MKLTSGLDINIDSPKMIFFLIGALLLFIQPAGGSSQHYRLLKPNVLVVEKEMYHIAEVTLLCGEVYEGAEVSWRREGALLEKRGNRINVTVEEMMGGNYTCHNSAGAVLNQQLVLVQLKGEQYHKRIMQKTEEADYIKCTSKNYSGVFHCLWKWSPYRVGTVVYISAERSTGRGNITCSVDSNDIGITCLDQFQCSYAEELDKINLAVYVKHMYRLEEYQSQFSIAEIVKPDMVSITKVNDGTFELGYPKTWSVPDSFFPLTFHIKVMTSKKGKDCNYKSDRVQESFTQNRTVSVEAKRDFFLCVRAQDALCNSGWSEWSHYDRKTVKEE